MNGIFLYSYNLRPLLRYENDRLYYLRIKFTFTGDEAIRVIKTVKIQGYTTCLTTSLDLTKRLGITAEVLEIGNHNVADYCILVRIMWRT